MKWLIAPLVLAVAMASACAEGSGKFSVGAFEFACPEGWEIQKPSSPMRKAQLLVPGEPGGADVTFFHFGEGQGGSPQANIQRWVGQFEGGMDNAMQKTEEFDGAKVWFVTASGTFQSGMPGGPTTPMEDYAVRGAILESASGDVFVKMTGPKSVVESAAEPFDAMVEAAAKSAE